MKRVFYISHATPEGTTVGVAEHTVLLILSSRAGSPARRATCSRPSRCPPATRS